MKGIIIEILRFYRLGKELGLSKKEISKLLIFDNSKHAVLWRILLIIFMIIIFVGWFNLVGFLVSKINENVYPSGAMYSTIKLKDFKKRFINF